MRKIQETVCNANKASGFIYFFLLHYNLFESRIDTIPNGHHTLFQMRTIPYGYHPEWMQFLMDTIPNGPHPE